MNEDSVKQIELLKTMQQTEPRAEDRKTKVDSNLPIREDSER